MPDYFLFIEHQKMWDMVCDDFRLPPRDHPWFEVPMLGGALIAQSAVRFAGAVRRAVAMREAAAL